MAEAENLNTSAALDTSGAETKSAKTVFDEGGDKGKGGDNVVWPEDWRKRVAGEDEKLLKKAERFASPADVFKAVVEAEKRISQGFKPVELTDKSTPEEVAEYRKQFGIPEEWTKYDTDLGNGLVWGDEDKPIIDHFLEHAHKSNIPQKYVTESLKWYNELQEAQAAMIEEADHEHRTNATVALKEEWGGDYKANLNAIKGAFNAVNESLFDKLFSSRNADGVLLGNDPDVVKAFATLARQANPAAMIAPGTMEDSSKSIDSEIAELTKKLGNSALPTAERNTYFNRLVQLNEAKERLK